VFVVKNHRLEDVIKISALEDFETAGKADPCDGDDDDHDAATTTTNISPMVDQGQYSYSDDHE
jgi:hypothetical protein